MFYATGDVTILSQLNLEDAMDAAAAALQIPAFVRDASGRWEESEVYTTRCFGLEFMFCLVRAAVPGAAEAEYGLSIFTTVDYPFDGAEKEVDAAPFCAFLLNLHPALRASADRDT